MPLPTTNLPWPPQALDGILEPLSQWSAWYTGDPAALRDAYGRDTARPSTRPSQRRGGVVGAVSRWWWGRPTTDEMSQRGQLHIPIAADIAQASADLLFAEPPTLTISGGGATQERLDELTGDGMLSTLAEAAEIGSALGGTYLRVTWDEEVSPDAPFLTTVHADAAWPEFRWGRLVGVTFWRKLAQDGQRVWRHLERHELDGQGVGIILHGLYEGTPDALGTVVPLAERLETAGLAGLVDAESSISTLSPGLAVTYIPNQRPQRRWRAHPLGVNLGRSDFDGVEPLMDALDETWSSWMRDLRLAKARLLVAQYMLDSAGPGTGTTFDADREVFSPLNLPPTAGGEAPITPVQFNIRVEEHSRTVDELTQSILRTAGYSAQTFGEGPEGAAITATEVQSRERRSFLTRDRKIRLWRPALGEMVEKLLAVDAALFNSGVAPQRPDVAFGDTVQDSPLATAQTAMALRGAQAASTRTLVALQHPDWDDTQVDQEVTLIRQEAGVPVEDPQAFDDGS